MIDYNRIILIGNGFDRAAGLKTRYKDFIDSYIKDAIRHFFSKNQYDSRLISISPKTVRYGESLKERLNVLEAKENAQNALKYIERVSNINYKYEYFQEIIENRNERWVDIEQYYFDTLMRIYNQKKNEKSIRSIVSRIKRLNLFMDILTSNLHDYISKIDEDAKIAYESSPLSPIIDKCLRPLNKNISGLVSRHNRNYPPTDVIFLNFNYTNTVLSLTNEMNVKHISIHGNVQDPNNPIIFGYGDDTNELYHRLELEDSNELIRKIKSFQYHRTRNYHRLLNILNSREFDVFIIGHSCGLSDRTLLKTIFEHENCLAIQNFHYKGESDDFNKRMQISRHFTDKVLMRERVLPFDKASIIPQYK
jgi:hypothetical protein